MRKFVILTDSACDLDKKHRDEYGIDYLPMHFIVDGKDYDASPDWENLSAKEFYNLMREGVRITSSQVTTIAYKQAFTNYIKDGFDVLSISTSSGLSASYNGSLIARDEVLADFPDAKIICIDSLKACGGLGIICIVAAKLRNEGKTIDEVAAWIECNKLRVHQEGTTDKLTYLRRAGRLSATSAFFGGLLNIKPIVVFDVNGKNCGVEKVKGRKASFERLAARVANEYERDPYQVIFFAHADCMDDVEELKREVLSKIDSTDVEIVTGYVGSAVGASCGPGMLAVYFIGKEITLNK